MSCILDALSRHAWQQPDALALRDASGTTTFAELLVRVETLAAKFAEHGCRSIALVADNGPEWVIADLAARLSGAAVVPVPQFFTEKQVGHVLTSAAVDTIVTQDGVMPPPQTEVIGAATASGRLRLWRHPRAAGEALPEGCSKITFTSGSTGAPKGVMLSGDTIDAVTQRLDAAFADLAIRRHLCSMPLATLLENIAGVYVPLLRGTCVCLPSLGELGLYGSSRIDAARFRRTIAAFDADSIIVQPETLRELTRDAQHENERQTSGLRFVAVGGAKVADADLEAAAGCGIPAFQGYGLSECASVVAINRPQDRRAGSVGRPLPGLDVRIAADGEILVTGQAMLGYVGEPAAAGTHVATGDIGYLDEDGYLFVTGRKKDVFITSFGRNVSPEWPESALLHEPHIRQACVFGEGRPVNTAIIVPTSGASDSAIGDAIARTNRSLPDYARIGKWLIAPEPFSTANGQLTATGKPRRGAIADRYMTDVEVTATQSTVPDHRTSNPVERNPV